MHPPTYSASSFVVAGCQRFRVLREPCTSGPIALEWLTGSQPAASARTTWLIRIPSLVAETSSRKRRRRFPSASVAPAIAG